MESVQAIKQRFGIIGNTPGLNRAIEKAIQVAPTDISVLVTGESGVGKESIPKIIHQLSHRKHNKYIAVNSSDTKRAHLREPPKPGKATSKWLMAEPFSSMK